MLDAFSLPSGITIAPMQPQHAEALAALQPRIFPTLDPAQLFIAAHYHAHLARFPAGQFVALDGEQVIGQTSTIRRFVDWAHYQHRFDVLLQDGWLTSHQPDGDWLYGMDIGVDPTYRRRGVARGLYDARQRLVRALALRGQVAGALLSGYGAHQHTHTAEDYLRAVQAGALTDPTLSAQLRVGFRVHGLLPDYVNDPACANYGAFIILPAEHDIPL